MRYLKTVFLAILFMAFVSFAGNTNKTCTRSGKIYTLTQTDTLDLGTGSSYTIYSSGTTGLSVSEFNDPDKVWVVIVGYGDADTTQAQIKIDMKLAGTVTWTTVKTDTVVYTGTSAQLDTVSGFGIKGSTMRVVVTAYGTTDTIHVEGLKIR